MWCCLNELNNELKLKHYRYYLIVFLHYKNVPLHVFLLNKVQLLKNYKASRWHKKIMRKKRKRLKGRRKMNKRREKKKRKVGK